MHPLEEQELQSSSSQNGAESRSRRSSITTQLTSHTRDSNGESQTNANTTQVDSVEQTLKEFQPIEYDGLVAQGVQLTEDPTGAEQWLSSYNYHKPGTDVSLRFRNIAADSNHAGPHSLIPLFVQWIPVWYKAAVNRRRLDKLPRDASYKEQDDLDWLLRYVADYIGLGHVAFDQEELGQLCLVITSLCQEAGRQSVIIDSIVILHRIMTETTLPQVALPSTLEVLCAATVTLPDIPINLFENVRPLITGPLQREAVDWLLECIMTPTVQNNSFHLIEARGAIRQVMHHLETRGSDGGYAIRLDPFLDSIHRASKCCIFRFCTDILTACQHVLESNQLQHLLTTDVRTFIGTLENCIRTVLPRGGSSRSFEAVRSPDRTQVMETQRQNEKYFAERRGAIRQVLSAFERVWSHLSDYQARLVGNFFMENAKDLNDGQAAVVVSHLSKQSLLMPGAEDWSQRLFKVYESFVRNSRISAKERIDAALLCIDAAAVAVSYAAKGPTESKESTLANGKNIVDRMLNLIGKEINTAVVRAVLNSLRYLTDCVDEQNKPQYATLIIGKLLYFVRTEREGEDEVSDEHVLLFTQAIRDIFLRGLHRNANVTVEAYEALLEIASARCRSRRCRLAALRLLLRVRCDRDGMVFVQTAFESDYIAAALCRTEESRDLYAKDLAAQQRASGPPITSPAHSQTARQLWIYPKEAACMAGWSTESSELVVASGAREIGVDQMSLNMTSWLVTVIESLQTDTDWETYSFILVHLGAQLFNVKLFSSSLQAIVTLRQVLCEQVHNNSFREPPPGTGLKKSDPALCMFNMLTALIPYAGMKSDKIQKGFGDDLVRAFIAGIGNTWDGTHRGCIHSLSVCSFEIPASVASSYPNIVQTMGKNMSQSNLTIHILEFLAQVARLPEVHSSFNQHEIQQIFGICLQFLEKTRETQPNTLVLPSPRSGTPARHSGINLRRPPYRMAVAQDTALPQYASALAYHTMIFWFLSLRLEIRAKLVSWIVPRLIWKNSKGEEVIEEQSQVFMDMMQRTAFSDLGETAMNPSFASDSDGAISIASWIVGLSIVTVQTAGHTGKTQITKRQASGTTYASYQQHTTSTPSHHAPLHTQLRSDEIDGHEPTEMLPPHIILQMVSTAAPTRVEDQPIYLPTEDYIKRALNVFDRIPTVDSHKIGVLYIGPGQSRESEYLANTTTSPNFERLLHGLGYRVSIEPPLTFNPQGLSYPRDGEATMAWRDRISEIVYHVPSMMPNNLDDDPACNVKKSHVGNCHVVIVFNESGLTWKLDNFASAVTLVQVIITPTDRAAFVGRRETGGGGIEQTLREASSTISTHSDSSAFYQVLVVTKENYPNVSPAADPKVISSAMLPAFVRMFSINANLFSQAKVAADSNDDEWPSSWRARLQAIKKLKERVIEKTTSGSTAVQSHAAPNSNTDRSIASTGRRTPVLRDENTGAEEDGHLAVQLDFGSWTSPADKDHGKL